MQIKLRIHFNQCWRCCWCCCYCAGRSHHVVATNCHFAWIYFKWNAENKRFMFNDKGVNCILDAALLWQSKEGIEIKSQGFAWTAIAIQINIVENSKQIYIPNVLVGFSFYFHSIDWVVLAWPFPRPLTPGYIFRRMFNLFHLVIDLLSLKLNLIKWFKRLVLLCHCRNSCSRRHLTTYKIQAEGQRERWTHVRIVSVCIYIKNVPNTIKTSWHSVVYD